MKTIIITGVSGQMGSWISEFCLLKGMKVYGAVRRLSVTNYTNIDHLLDNENFSLVNMDLTDASSIRSEIKRIQPDYFINCAANSFVGTSWALPEQHMDCNAMGVLRQLEAIKDFSPHTRYLNFGSSEEFGDIQFLPQTEDHPLRARSPYAASKIAARQLVKVYRESYGLYAVQCWCFNYESERRGLEFVTRKITDGIAKIVKSRVGGGKKHVLELGNMDAFRDWSHAVDFVDGVWRMLNQEEYNISLKQNYVKSGLAGIDDSQKQSAWLSERVQEYVFSSGKAHSVREFVNYALEAAGVAGGWHGEGLEEKFIIHSINLQLYEDGFPTISRTIECEPDDIAICVNPEFYRPAEVDMLHGDSTFAREDLGWESKTTLKEMVSKMVRNDIQKNIQ